MIEPGGGDKVQWWRIAAVVVLPVLILTGTTMLVLVATTHPVSPADRIDVVKTALSVGAGTGGVVALVLTWRRQWHVEKAQQATEHDATERRITEIYGKAVEQLGSEKAPVRLGGLYALERLAQDNPQRRQHVVNVICAYLRMPYELPGSAPAVDDPPDMRDDHQERVAERQVRLAAQDILSEHLRPNPSTFWPDIDLNLVGAHLIGINMRGCHIRTVRFSHAEFKGCAAFGNAVFNGDADFAGAEVEYDALFDGVVFNNEAGFDSAKFDGRAVFDGAKFNDFAGFYDAKFDGEARFFGAVFKGDAAFGDTEFDGDAGFGDTKFDSEARFFGAVFKGDAVYRGAKFKDDAMFRSAKFNDFAGFYDAKFDGDAMFDRAKFNGDAWFDDVEFDGRAEFNRVEFNGDAEFKNARFTFVPIFNRAKFAYGTMNREESFWVRLDGNENGEGLFPVGWALKRTDARPEGITGGTWGLVERALPPSEDPLPAE